MNTLLFFTSCDGIYKQFIIPYIYFASLFNNDCSFEIIVDDIDQQIKDGCDYLSCRFNNNIVLTNKQFDIPAKYLRFLQSPSIKCQYTYIGDIDILIIENILPFHLNKLIEYNSIIDNQTRLTNTNRLTGLHFVQSDPYFNLIKKQQNYILYKFDNNNISKLNDENMLMDICKKSDIKIPPLCRTEAEMYLNRPTHGLHMSLNRLPFNNKTSIKNHTNNLINRIIFKQFIESDYDGLKSYLSDNFVKNLNILKKFLF